MRAAFAILASGRIACRLALVSMSIGNQKMYVNFSSFMPGLLNYLLVAVQMAGFALSGFWVVRQL